MENKLEVREMNVFNAVGSQGGGPDVLEGRLRRNVSSHVPSQLLEKNMRGEFMVTRRVRRQGHVHMFMFDKTWLQTEESVCVCVSSGSPQNSELPSLFLSSYRLIFFI